MAEPMSSSSSATPSEIPEPAAESEEKFYPLRTVVFYPIYEQYNLARLDEFLGAFGDVASKKVVFGSGVGCVVVVYSSPAGAYTAVHSLEELNRRIPWASHLRGRVLWPLLDLIDADRENGSYVSVECSSVRDEREVLVPLTFKVTEELLRRRLDDLGCSVEKLEVLPYRPDLPLDFRQTSSKCRAVASAARVTFKEPLDAAIFLVCSFGLDLSAALRMKPRRLYLQPTCGIQLLSSSACDSLNFHALYRDLREHHEECLFVFRSPRTVFTTYNRFVIPGALPSIRLPVIDGEVSSVIVATSKGNSPLTYFELEFYFTTIQNNGLFLPKILVGEHKWVSYFFFDIEKIYSQQELEFTFQLNFRVMNHAFSKLYPNIFERNHYDFAFRAPTRCRFTPVSSDQLRRARLYHVHRAESVGKASSLFSKPFVLIVDPTDKWTDHTRTVWHLPIVVHSDSITI